MRSEASSANDNTLVLNLTPWKLRLDSRDVLCERARCVGARHVRLALSCRELLDTVASAEARKLPRRRVAI